MAAPGLLLLHGYPFDHTVWDAVRAAGLGGAAANAPDLLAPPESLPGEPSLDLLADSVAANARNQGMPRLLIAGFSMGGYLSLALAERHPQMVAGLALINSQTLADTDQVRAARRALIEQIRQKGWLAAVEAANPKLFARPTADLVRFASRGAERAGVPGLCWALEAMARRPDRTGILVECPAPVLIVHSTADQFIPIQRARELAASRPQTLYCELEGAGHTTPLEDPGGVSAGLRQWVARCQK